MIRDRWLIGMILGGIAAGIFAYFKLQEVPEYHASASMIIEITGDRVVNIEEVVDTDVKNDIELFNHLATLNSRSFLERVIQKIPDAKVAELTESYETPENPNPSIMGIVAGGRRIHRKGDSFIFHVGFRHRDPEMAQYLANLYAEEYRESLLDRTGTGTARAMKFLEARAEELRQKVQDGERALQQYRQQKNLVSLEESQNIVVDRLRSISGALNKAELDELTMKAVLSDIEAAKQEGRDLLTVQRVAKYGNIGSLRTRLEELNANKEILSRKYLERHPKMVKVEDSIRTTRNQLDQNIESALREINNQYDVVQRRLSKLREELANAEQEALALDKTKIEYDLMRNKVRQDQAMLTEISSRLNETQVSSQLENSNIRILDQAGRPGKPVSPDRDKIILTASAIFAALFLAVPIGIEFLNNRVHTHWDIETFLKRTLLGDLPNRRRLTSSELAQAVLRDDEPSLIEGFRVLYSHVSLASKVDFPKSLLITSTIPGEGKSFVASNLASAYAKHGKTVLLFDTDFRRPTIHRNFQMENDYGFLRWWSESSSRLISPIGVFEEESLGLFEPVTNLFILRSGGSTKATSEIFASDEFSKFVQHLKQNFQVVIFDTPPSGVFPDALILAKHSDESLYVIKHDTISRSKVRGAIDRLEKTGSEILGVVLNAVSSKARRRGGGGSYSYGYGYNSYYDYRYQEKYYKDRDQKDSRTAKKKKRQKKEAGEAETTGV